MTLRIIKRQQVYYEKQIFQKYFFFQVGEGQDVYFECLSQANPPVCKINLKCIKLSIIIPFPDNIVHIKIDIDR